MVKVGVVATLCRSPLWNTLVERPIIIEADALNSKDTAFSLEIHRKRVEHATRLFVDVVNRNESFIFRWYHAMEAFY